LCRRNIHQVSKEWNSLGISSGIMCRKLSLPYVYDIRTAWDMVLRWISRRAGRIEVLKLFAYPEKTPDASCAYVCPDDTLVVFFMCVQAHALCVCVCVRARACAHVSLCGAVSSSVSLTGEGECMCLGPSSCVLPTLVVLLNGVF
jgi:hypothetical protein